MQNEDGGDAIYRLSSDAFGCQTILSVIVSGTVAVGTMFGLAGEFDPQGLVSSLRKQPARTMNGRVKFRWARP